MNREKAPTLNVDGKEITEKQLRKLFDQQGLRTDSSYLLEHLLPKYEAIYLELVREASDTEDLLRCQGGLKLLHDLRIYTEAIVKKSKKVEI